MANNYVTNVAADGVSFASDEDVSTIHWPYVKLVFGADNTQTIVTAAAPLPVTLISEELVGNLDVNLAASAITLNTSSAISNGAGAAAVNIQDGGNVITVDGTVTANAGSGTFTISGTVTANAGTGTMTVTDDGSFSLATADGVDIGDVTINNAGLTDAVNIQDGGNSITIDGTVTANAGTGTMTVTDAGDFVLAANSGVDIGDVTINNAAGASAVNIQDGGNVITVDGTVTANAGTGTMTVTDDGSFSLAAADGVDIGDVTINNAAGASAVNIQDGGNVITVDGAVVASGDVAHDTGDSGNPVKIGAVGRTANPTAVTTGDRVNVYADVFGRLVMQPYVPRDLSVHNTITLTDTTETSLIAEAASTFHDLVWLFLSNSSATQTVVEIRDSSTGTVRLRVTLAASGGGAQIALPIQLKQAAVNTAWTAKCLTGVSSVYVTAIAIKST